MCLYSCLLSALELFTDNTRSTIALGEMSSLPTKYPSLPTFMVYFAYCTVGALLRSILDQ